MKWNWLVVLSLVITVPDRLAAQDPSADRARMLYDSLEARLVAGDTTIDFQALRFAYVETPDYDPYGVTTGETRERMMNAFFRAGDLSAARDAADSLLRTVYVDIDAHMIAALASSTLGDSARSRFHASVARGLAASIEQPGLGTVAEAPYEVISVVEEDALLRMRGWRRGSQALTTCRGQPCDRLEVSRPSTGESKSLYFDISRPRAFLSERTEP